MHDIFLSYASADLLRVQPLIQTLQEHGWSVWWDRTIPPGQTFEQVIQAALDASRCVMVIWSEAAVVSDWVREEATEGRERHILIPVMLDEVRPPLGFRQIQAARLFQWQGERSDVEFVRLVQAVTHLIGEPHREETSIQTPTVPQDTEVGQAPQPEPLPGAEIAAAPEPEVDTRHEQTRNEAQSPPVPPKRPVSPLVWLVPVGVLLIAMLWLVIPKTSTPPTVPQSATQPKAETNPKPEAKPVVPDKTETPSPPKTYTNRIGMQFALIPAGTFRMGSDGPQADDDEKPVHQVNITRPFYLGIYEVTQAQWKTIMEENPSHFQGDANRPVEQVSWEDVQRFLSKLNAQEKGAPYRLPTEAEWEYAARAETTTAYSFGDDASRLGEYAWYDGNAKGTTHAVGQLKPNAWGLYDMHGNVFEWVQDWYRGYTAEPTADPQGPSSGAGRVMRGGGWLSGARNCRSAYRYVWQPGHRNFGIGFRVLRRLE